MAHKKPVSVIIIIIIISTVRDRPNWTNGTEFARFENDGPRKKTMAGN